MHAFPHRYAVSAASQPSATVNLTSDNVSPIESAPPAEFGGPGDKWSPESLLVAAVADCFVLSFHAIARASKLEWQDVTCDVVGVLDKVDGVTRFTGFEVSARLTVPAGVDPEKAEKLLHKSEQVCLVTNSLIADSHLTTDVTVAS